MDSGDEEASGESAEEEPPPLPASAAEVKTFAEMVRMAPGLRAGAPRMAAEELAAICLAAGRVKFYDAALIETVGVHLSRRCGDLAADKLVEVLSSFAGLNAYNRELFSAAARTLGNGAASCLDASQLKVLVTSFKSVKHTNDAVFLETLAQRERQARYEAAKEDILRDELDRRWIR